MSTKSTKLLNSALNFLEQNDINILVWRETRKPQFVDAFKLSSATLVPLPNIWEEREAAFTLSTKGLFTLELFSNLHSVFTNHDFHFVSCDRVLSWEVCAVFHRINEKLIQPTLPTPKADKIFNSLHSNLNNNILFILGD